MLYFNTIQPAAGAKKNPRRVGRGIGSGRGKTCGKGHKGQRARAGGYHKLGFEGGQMPLQRRLPKFGFNSRKAKNVASIKSSALNKLNAEHINLLVFREAGLVSNKIKSVRIILSGTINKPLTISADIHLTKGAIAAVVAAGGKVES